MKKTINVNPSLQLNYEKSGKRFSFNAFENIAVFENLNLRKNKILKLNVFLMEKMLIFTQNK